MHALVSSAALVVTTATWQLRTATGHNLVPPCPVGWAAGLQSANRAHPRSRCHPQALDELGVPWGIALNLTFPETVTPHNIERCAEWGQSGVSAVGTCKPLHQGLRL